MEFLNQFSQSGIRFFFASERVVRHGTRSDAKGSGDPFAFPQGILRPSLEQVYLTQYNRASPSIGVQFKGLPDIRAGFFELPCVKPVLRQVLPNFSVKGI